MPAAAPEPSARVEAIDPYHKDWSRALKFIDRVGQRERLGIGPDGWLPARRNLLVAFVGDEPAGHLSFNITPVIERSAASCRTRLVAQVDSQAIEQRYDVSTLRQQLEQAARQRARDLRCDIFQLEQVDGD